jgi:aryl-alcohol dehydrogenase
MITEALVTQTCGGAFKFQKVQLDDTLRPGECLVRIKATGVCHTDLNFSREESMPEMFPGVFGHEGAGIVERVGSNVTAVEKGDHVIVCFTSCGECKYCESKQTPYCDLWFKYNFGIGRLDGSKTFSDVASGKKITSHFFGQSSFAKHVVVSQMALVKIDKSVPFDKAAPLGCGVMTGAGAMLNVIQPTSDMSVCVVGVGAVGMSAIMALKTLDRPPKRIIAVDIVAARLELARKYGATHGVNSKLRPELMKILLEITQGQGIDGAVDTTGKPEVVEEIIHSAARKGKVVAVGVGGLGMKVPIGTFEAVQAGLQYFGCNQGDAYPQEFLPKLLKANEEGRFAYDEMIKKYPAKEINKAGSDMMEGITIKPVLLWD